MAPSAGSVWLDARGAQSVAHAERGIPRQIAEHSRALVSTAPEWIRAIGLDPALPAPGSFDPLLGSGLFRWHSNTRPPEDGAPDIFHVMSPFEVELGAEDIWPWWVRHTGCRLVVTLHDLIPMLMAERYNAVWGQWATAWVARVGLMRNAHQILAISQSTADDAIRLLGIPEERVTVIDSGVSGRFSSLVGSTAEARALVAAELPRVRPGSLLYVGGPDYRKNLDGTIRAYARLPRDLQAARQLVIAGNLAPLRKLSLLALARRLGIPARSLVLTGFVSDRLLAALYRDCGLFIFPSLYEGAGLPILEAMSCGAPVVASGVSAMPELLGDPEGTFDPEDPDDMARCIREALGTPGALERLLDRSRRQVGVYTWDRVAEQTVRGYERALEAPLERATPRPRRGRRRKRVAVFTPWPPQDSETAVHSRRLVEALGDRADVDVIVSEDAWHAGVGFDDSLSPAVEIRNDAQFRWQHEARGYDRCLYVLADSALHLHALESLVRVPGVVLAHDVRLLGLYLDMQRHSHPYEPLWVEEKLLEMYGDRMPHSLLRQIPFDEPRAKRRVNMTREVQSSAQRILVHSSHQAELLAMERPRDGAPVEVLPYGVPDPPERTGAGPDGPPLIAATADEGAWPKLLEAFSTVAHAHPGARLLLGDRDGRARAGSMRAMAGRLGVERALEPAGADEVRRSLPAAVLAVHLRMGADGGTASGEVCDSVAARVPTIVTDQGWPGELPDRVALPVAADCTASELAAAMSAALTDEALIGEVRAAQDGYAGKSSFAGVAERCAALLSL